MPVTTEERVAKLEVRMAALETQVRTFIAKQMLNDPQVQEMLQRQIVARLGGELPQPQEG